MTAANGATGRLRNAFGTQRYHVRIELYESEEVTLPNLRIASWGPEDLEANVARFPTVVASLPDALAPGSRVFGLTQLELPASTSRAARDRLRDLAGSGLAFSRVTVIRDHLRAADVAIDEQVWRPIDLGAAPRWGDDAAAGDLLRVGERIVVLYQDRGRAGEVDYEDLCFDFVRGADRRALGDVFSGEGLVVEIQRLSRGTVPPPRSTEQT